MKKFYYDLHTHSCLSPCGDDDNTPNNIVGMASLCGLEILALTDHNSCKNCPAFFEVAKKYGIIPIAGMELTTSEDIHVVCLFESLKDALSFDEYVENNRTKFKNKPELFGHQRVLDKEDNPIFEIEDLLINATNISISQVGEIVRNHKGICYPAHIDRESNGIIAVLGSLPEDIPFDYYELHDSTMIEEYSKKFGIPKSRFIVSSDAHYLTEFRDKECYFELEDNDDPKEIVKHLFNVLRRPKI